MHRTRFIDGALLIVFIYIVSLVSCASSTEGTISGELKKWHPISITFEGPFAQEAGVPNPFRDYRMMVTFYHESSGTSVVVPGYFAADGNAGESGATEGRKWRVHFTPNREGEWAYLVSFREGTDVAIGPDENDGIPSSLDGLQGVFSVTDTDKKGRDHRGKGMLRYVGERYLRFDDGSYYVKGGADSPENLLAYADFDNTYSLLQQGQEREGEAPTAALHAYEPHLTDWNLGDPTWKEGKGKALIGALNYLAGKGVNVFSFLTMNVEGDGQDVWPWIEPNVRDRFDVSKLDQWEVVFSHADSLGLFLHFKTQETENDTLLDGGALGVERKLYYRELIARFGHHHASNWNLGEENDIWEELNDPTLELVKEYINYIHALDPYDHPVVIHTYPGQYEQVYRPLLGNASNLDGLSIQTAFDNVHTETVNWIKESEEAGRKWVVSNDEQGHHTIGVTPDGPNSNRDDIRKQTLWGNLMAGGAGVEYYFGYTYAHNDLNMEDWRSRDLVWDDVRHALHFFYTHLPFWDMQTMDHLASQEDVYVFGNPGNLYAVYAHKSQDIWLELGEDGHTYSVEWYNPRSGGGLQTGNKTEVTGAGKTFLGLPPHSSELDWVALLKRPIDSCITAA